MLISLLNSGSMKTFIEKQPGKKLSPIHFTILIRNRDKPGLSTTKTLIGTVSCPRAFFNVHV